MPMAQAVTLLLIVAHRFLSHPTAGTSQSDGSTAMQIGYHGRQKPVLWGAGQHIPWPEAGAAALPEPRLDGAAAGAGLAASASTAVATPIPRSSATAAGVSHPGAAAAGPRSSSAPAATRSAEPRQARKPRSVSFALDEREVGRPAPPDSHDVRVSAGSPPSSGQRFARLSNADCETLAGSRLPSADPPAAGPAKRMRAAVPVITPSNTETVSGPASCKRIYDRSLRLVSTRCLSAMLPETVSGPLQAVLHQENL